MTIINNRLFDKRNIKSEPEVKKVAEPIIAPPIQDKSAEYIKALLIHITSLESRISAMEREKKVEIETKEKPRNVIATVNRDKFGKMQSIIIKESK
jgi:hypothetical protein